MKEDLSGTEEARTGRWLARTACIGGAAGLVVAAWWAAGAPTAWLDRLQGARATPAPSAADAPRPSSSAASPTLATGAQAPADASAGVVSSISLTPQPLFLIATTPGRNASEGAALIGTHPEHPQTYLAGAILANGAKLKEIHADHVILARGDASAKLFLHRADDSQRGPISALLAVGGEGAPAPPPVSTREALTDYLRPTPVYEGERLRGYQVYPGPKAHVFSHLGLKAADLITALDDLPFADPQQAIEMFNQLTRGAAVVATLERQGATLRVTLDGALIRADQDDARKLATGTPRTPAS